MKGGQRAVFGGLDDDDEDDFFAQPGGVSLSQHQDKHSANFNQDPLRKKSVEKIDLGDFEVNTFGRQAEEISKSRYDPSVASPVQSDNHMSFKHSAKYNKYVQKEPKKPTRNENPIDHRTKDILKDDDLGEVGEWAGKTLNHKNKLNDSEIDSEEEAAQQRKKMQDDDDFDFMNSAPKDKTSPNTQSTGGTVPGVDDNQEALRQKIQMKLEGKGLRMGGGAGAGLFSNKLVNKQKELQSIREEPVAKKPENEPYRNPKAISPPIPQIDHGFQSPQSDQGDKKDADAIMAHGALKLGHSTGVQAPVVNFRMSGGRPAIGAGGGFDDEWEDVNKQTDKKLAEVK